MATFSALQTRVQSNVIDLPTAVLNQVPTFVNVSIYMIQTLHNFRVMQAEQPFITPTQTPTQTHVLGQVPSNWKAPRGEPYYVRFIGSSKMMAWEPEREYLYRQWSPNDVNQIGDPRVLFLGEPQIGVLSNSGQSPADPGNPDYAYAQMNIEVYPFPDGSSDWSDGKYRINIPYWGYVPALSAGSDSNWFTADGPRAEFVIAWASKLCFDMDWDEGRATAWMNTACGPKWDGWSIQGLGGYARQIIALDSGMQGTPSKTLVPRQDILAPRDHWRR